jgi:hypothetical protein
MKESMLTRAGSRKPACSFFFFDECFSQEESEAVESFPQGPPTAGYECQKNLQSCIVIFTEKQTACFFSRFLTVVPASCLKARLWN